MGSTDRKQIKSTRTAFSIVERISSTDGATVSELAETLGRSKSTVHAHLQTLTEMGYLFRIGDEYHVGLPFLTLGGAARSTDRYQNLYRAAKAEIDDIVDQTGERAQVVVEYQGEGIYFYQSRGHRYVQTDSQLGTSVSLHSTAVGKTILSVLPDDRVEEILSNSELQPRTANTVVDRDELRERIETIRDRGYAYDREERIEGICCVAAPIECGPETIASLSVTVPTKRASGEYFEEELPTLVTNVARVIELNTQYS
ncbi:IclR family transcriptional regulator [Natrialba sp. PRR66]|uniref:IclR family transcriptional regulator n=1 Tax=Natrialba sp. PRR66 TaxID=3098146 RepID=UPI002B1E2833|nr:IclR family transcriptional regulator [Natrialba sp. PRR66]